MIAICNASGGFLYHCTVQEADERIQEIRIMGGCACIEVKNPDTLRGYQQFAYERGVFSRPFLSYMYSMVPYIIEEEQLVKIFDTMKAWFKEH